MAKHAPRSRPPPKPASSRKRKQEPKSKTKGSTVKVKATTELVAKEEYSDDKTFKSVIPAARPNVMSHAVTRLMRLKFAHVSRTKLATVVDSSGDSLDDVIGAEIRKTNVSGEYIKAKFWAALESDFGLQCADWEALAEPADEIAELDPYDADLPSIILSVLGDNPAMKSKGLDRLEVHLESCDRLPLRQVYGLLSESCESSTVSRAQSQRFQWMLLRYVAKHAVFDSVANLSYTSPQLFQIADFRQN